MKTSAWDDVLGTGRLHIRRITEGEEPKLVRSRSGSKLFQKQLEKVDLEPFKVWSISKFSPQKRHFLSILALLNVH